MKEIGFRLKKAKRRYMAKNITDADYALLANTPAQAESLLHSLEQTTGGIDLHVSSNKTEYMHFKWQASKIS